MATSNRTEGTRFESEFCELLSNNGFWAHNCVQSFGGQPADVVAVKNTKGYLIDCKVCDTDKGFELKRIEPNQESAMKLFERCGNGVGWFALRLPTETGYEILMTSLPTLLHYRDVGVKALKPEILRSGVAIPFADWLETIKERKTYEDRNI